MAYPFLPVDPCCTDVVINDVCGCSSVITNSGCNTNDPCSTILTASSTVIYNGPALTCTTAEPCDTLNVILQKIDEVICNLLFQINALTIQVNNITTQLIQINGNITTIYNTLDVCCAVTTTTTTTVNIPCESFSLDNTGTEVVAVITTDCVTGELFAVVLEPGVTNICVQTDSPLTVPGTIIVTPNGPCGPTTTTTTSSSSTTTTTTTAYPCECLTFTNTDNNIVDYNISYNDCLGDFIETTISANEIIKVCGCCGLANTPLVTISIGAICVDNLCPTTTTTTTVAPTTTTTTTIYTNPCTCITVTISQADLDDATGNTPAPGKADNTVYLTTSKSSGCDGTEIAAEYTVAGPTVDGFCIKVSELSTIQLFYYKDDAPVYFPTIDSTYTILYTTCSTTGECNPV